MLTQLERAAGRAKVNHRRPVESQDLLTPRTGNQLIRSRAGAQPSCFEIWRTKLFPATSRRRSTRAMCHHSKSPVSSYAAVEALQDQELMAQARISACRAARVWKQAGTQKSTETKRVNTAPAAYKPKLCKFNFFNQSGFFGRDSFSTLSHIFC
jgi:hypothetical protein